MKIFIAVAKIVVITAILVWAFLKFDLDTARRTIQASDLYSAVLAIVLCGLAYYFTALRWGMIIRGFWPKQKISSFKLFWFNILSAFYGLFIPTSVAAEAVRVIKLGKETKKDYSRSTITVALDRILGMIIWGLIFLFSPSPIKRSNAWFLLFAVIPLLYLFRNKLNLWGHKVFDFSRHHPADIVKSVIFSVIGQFLFVASYFFIFRCFGISIPPKESIGIVATATMAGIVPISWLGVGLREASYLGMLPLYGASATQSLLAVSFIVFLTYFFGIAAGILELAHTGWHISKLKMPLKQTDTANE